jgi:hypothetical protein
MLIGFIAIIVILLVIIGVMSTGTNSEGNAGKYATEVKKVQTLISNMKNEAKFYYLKTDSFKDISMKYYKDIGFADNVMVNSEDADHEDMNSNDWDGWPSSGITDPYTGSYIKLGGTAKDDIRLVIVPLSKNKAFGIYVLKRKTADIPEGYLSMLEKVLSADSSYIGG